MRIINQTDIKPHVLQLPELSLASKVKSLAAKILASGGANQLSTTVDKARAIVGWFAANAVHPQAFLHPDGTTLNTSVLPSGETWATFNAAFNTTAAIDRDQAYWYSMFPNGIAMLEKLVGTIANDGTVSDNGLLTEYQTGKWRIRGFDTWRAPQCTLQCKMAQVVLASVGIQSIDISTVGHDPMAFYDDFSKKWLYIDPTFGEMQTLMGNRLSPLDLLESSLSGYSQSIIGEKLPGADYIPVGYFTSPNVTPGGMSFMTIHTAPQWAGGLSDRAPYRFGNLPSQSATNDRVGSISKILPEIGCGTTSALSNNYVCEIKLRSNIQNFSSFQRSFDRGLTWAACTSVDYVNPGSGDVYYRSVDTNGFGFSYARIFA